MLPADFYWQTYIDGPGLYVKGRLVATITRVTNGYRITTTPGSRPPWHHFMKTEEGSRRYLEAWATKWEAQIRGSSSSAILGMGHLAMDPDPKATKEAATREWYRRRGRKVPPTL